MLPSHFKVLSLLGWLLGTNTDTRINVTSVLFQIYQKLISWQDQPKHPERRRRAEEPGAGRGSAPEHAGSAHVAGHQQSVL